MKHTKINLVVERTVSYGEYKAILKTEGRLDDQGRYIVNIETETDLLYLLGKNNARRKLSIQLVTACINEIAEANGISESNIEIALMPASVGLPKDTPTEYDLTYQINVQTVEGKPLIMPPNIKYVDK
uniref:Uncharacterized protein n=1 Tax=Pithovirus LCPAC103 TaxID=2506588 RepID=A0A481Z5S4_9VIRU|nr:MAG: hypothetical protein LCPAC103_01400 [Pithovirus LCPAC103]